MSIWYRGPVFSHCGVFRWLYDFHTSRTKIQLERYRDGRDVGWHSWWFFTRSSAVMLWGRNSDLWMIRVLHPSEKKSHCVIVFWAHSFVHLRKSWFVAFCVWCHPPAAGFNWALPSYALCKGVSRNSGKRNGHVEDFGFFSLILEPKKPFEGTKAKPSGLPL